MISIVIPTYNHLEDCLKPCLESIIKYTDLSDIEVLIVANGCKDNTREYVESLGEPFKLIWIDEPAGYTKATNVGLEASKGEFIVLLNNDTVLLPQPKNKWIEILQEPFFKIPQTGITGPAMGWDNNSKRHFLIFFCVMMCRNAYNCIGKLDEIFSPGFGEDTDWCIKATQAGFRVLQVPTADPLKKGTGKLMIGNFPIFHAGEQTFGEDDTKFQWIIKKNNAILTERYSKDLPHGYFSEQDQNVYKSFVGRVPKGSRIAEVGVLQGRALCSVAETLISHDLKVTAVDWFAGTVSENSYSEDIVDDNKAMFEKNIERFGLSDRVTVVKGDSTKSASLFPDHHFHCVFIDADHSYESVKKDINAWWDKVVPGGILCGHDYQWYGVRQAIEEKFGAESIHTDLANMWYVDKPMVYDCFMFANELDILELRLNELKDVVDKFVITEAPLTQSGLSKPLYLKDNMKRFEKFKDKIIHIIVDDMPKGEVNPWDRERHQRDAIMRGLVNLKDEDIVMISDADEIPRAEAVKNYRKEQGIMSFEQQMSYYFVNYVSKDKWEWGKILPYKLFKNMTPCQVRYTHNTKKIPNGGWHFSFLGGVDKIIEKIKGYAHQEYNKPEILDRNRIERLVDEGKDVFGRPGIVYDLKEVDDTYPQYLIENKNKFSHLIRIKKNNKSIKKDILNESIKKVNGLLMNTVTAVICTKNRYHTTLPLAVLSVIHQTHKVDKLIVFDDGEHKDLREDPLWQNIFLTLANKNIEWAVSFSDGTGQVKNHQRSIEMCKTEWIWRLDDDNYAEATVLEKLLSVADEKTGAVGGLVLDPKLPKTMPIASSKIEKVYEGWNKQWFKHNGVSEADHLYSTFIYRKKAGKHGYCEELSVIGHREETIFTHEMKRNGWKLLINPEAVTWHYRSGEGGIRSFNQKELWDNDETVFSRKMKEWGIDTEKPKVAVLDSGLGDHLAFRNILPDLKKKYPNLVLAVCYPEVFKDDDVKLISIAEAKALGNIEESNIYKFMWDNNWKTSMIDAYRRMYNV